jgi:hypothetical protein
MSYIFIGVTLVSLAGTAVSVQGQRNAATAADQAAKYNSQLQKQQATQTGLVAAENARRKTRENARIIGAQRAAIGASGLSMEGTPLAVLGETAMMLQRDILDIGYDSANQSRQLRAAAKMSIYEGKTQSSALKTSAVATGLSGVSSAASGYGDAKGLFVPKTTTTPKTTGY